MVFARWLFFFARSRQYLWLRLRRLSLPSHRARDLGVSFDGAPGPFNAITDVPGVSVGHTTLISGEGKLQFGKEPVRTGVTAVLPRGKDSWNNPVFAGWWSLLSSPNHREISCNRHLA